MNNTRLAWLDITKGIAIILMVLGHTSIPTLFHNYIFSFHMPLFFLVSGYMFKNKYNFKEYIIRKTKQLLIPYITFAPIINIIALTTKNYHLDPKDWVNFIINGTDLALWFLIILYLTQIIFYLVTKYINNSHIKVAVIILLIILGYYFSLKNIHIPYKIETIGMSILFFAIGNFIKKINLLNKEVKNNTIITIILVVLNIFLVYFSNTSIDMRNNNWGIVFLSPIISLIGIFSITLLSHSIMKIIFLKNILCYTGENTIVIVCLSQLFSVLIKTYTENYITLPNYLFMVLRQVILWSLLFISIYIFNKYCPYLIGKNKYNR